RWRAQVRRVGQSPLSKTFASRGEATAWARDIEHKIDRGQTVDLGRKFTFSEVVEAYRKHLSAKGMGRSKSHSLDKIERVFGRRRLVELKTPIFVDFCKTREGEGAGPATILQDLSYVGTVLRHGGVLIGAEHATATAITSLDAARRTLHHSGRIAKAAERDR